MVNKRTGTFNSYIVRSPDDSSPVFCVKCGKDKPLSNFYKHSVRGDGAIRYRQYCKDCRTKGGRKHWPRPKHAKILEAGEQTCGICLETKPLVDFYANGCFADGTKKYRTSCKSCVLKARKIKHPEIYKTSVEVRSESPKNYMANLLLKASRRKDISKFDLTIAFLCDLFTKQDGKCAISGVPMTYIAGKGRQATNISIDRICSDGHYSRDNVQLVCLAVNVMKQSFSTDELVSWCSLILAQNAQKSKFADQ